MGTRRSSEKTIEHRQRIRNIEAAPLLGNRLVDGQDVVGVAGLQLSEPFFQGRGGRLVATPDIFNPLADLPQSQHAQVDAL